MLSWAFHTIIFLRKYLKNNDFDVCITFFSIPGWIVAKYVKEKFNIPYIISTHWADIPWFYPEKMKKFHFLTNWYAKIIWEQATQILCLTTDMKKLADIFWDPTKNIILPNGCSSDFFYLDFSKKNKMFTLLFVWRLCHEKDPFILLSAIKELHFKVSNFMLYIIWDGPLKKDMEIYIKKNHLENNVKLIWWISKEELRKYYQLSHIQICSSKVEAMSVAILEALYSWLYILSTPISWNTDMIKEKVTWEFFNIWDSKQLAEKLLYWSTKYEEIVINRSEINLLKQKYNWDNIIYRLNEKIKCIEK
jgi:glycosyltransferase involved in cell wall biosynthesis